METFYILARQNGNAIQYVESYFNGCCSIELTISCKVARIFQKCELWTEKAYINANHTIKRFRSHRIASKKMDLLYEAGMSCKDAQKLVIMEGEQKVNKTNLSLLGKLLWIGTIEELSNKQNLWNKSVCDCCIKGLFRKKIQIIIKDGDMDA